MSGGRSNHKLRFEPAGVLGIALLDLDRRVLDLKPIVKVCNRSGEQTFGDLSNALTFGYATIFAMK